MKYQYYLRFAAYLSFFIEKTIAFYEHLAVIDRKDSAVCYVKLGTESLELRDDSIKATVTKGDRVLVSQIIYDSAGRSKSIKKAFIIDYCIGTDK